MIYTTKRDMYRQEVVDKDETDKMKHDRLTQVWVVEVRVDTSKGIEWVPVKDKNTFDNFPDAAYIKNGWVKWYEERAGNWLDKIMAWRNVRIATKRV